MDEFKNSMSEKPFENYDRPMAIKSLHEWKRLDSQLKKDPSQKKKNSSQQIFEKMFNPNTH